MADKFWVGGSGNWNDNTNHWSDTSGGAPGATLPGSTDDCKFDVNSFTASSRTLTFNVAADVKSMDFSACDESVIVTPTAGCTIRGDLTLKSGMTWGNTGVSMTFETTGTTCNINTAGVTLGIANLIIGGSGTFNLQSNVTVNRSGISGTFKPNGSGIINTNNFNITCLDFTISAGITNTINLGSSTITIIGTGGGTDVWTMQSTVSFNAETSTIIITGNTVDFIGAGATYNAVSFTGTPISITGANTFNSLTISAGKQVNFPANTIQTITTLNAVGTSASNIKFRVAGGGANTATLCVTSLNIAYVDTIGIIASCGASPFYCPTCVDNGSNVNWTFSNPVPGAPGGIFCKPRFSDKLPVKSSLSSFINQTGKLSTNVINSKVKLTS